MQTARSGRELSRSADFGELLRDCRATDREGGRTLGHARRLPNVDGIIALVHGTGCGIAAKGEEFDALMRTQWGYAGNPNIGAILMVGLGCEVFQIGRMKEEYGIVESESFPA